jgi:hypothetical protein
MTARSFAACLQSVARPGAARVRAPTTGKLAPLCPAMSNTTQPALAPEQRVVLKRRGRRHGRCLASTSVSELREQLAPCWLHRRRLRRRRGTRLVDALLAWGSEADIRSAGTGDHDAGADHVCLQGVGLVGRIPHRRMAPCQSTAVVGPGHVSRGRGSRSDPDRWQISRSHRPAMGAHPGPRPATRLRAEAHRARRHLQRWRE